MTRVLHLVGVMNRAGIETFIMNVYRNIDRSLIQFDFLCYKSLPGDYDQEIRDLGGSHYYISNDKFNYKSKLMYFGMYQKYREAFKKINPSIIHIHGHHAFDLWIIVMAARAASIENIIVHSHNTYAPHPALNKLFSKRLNKVTKLACGIDSGKWLFGNNTDFKVIYNGVDTNKFSFSKGKRDMIRRELNIDTNKHVILHVGRFEEQKNHKFIIEVFNEYYKKYPETILLLVGDGILKDEIEKKVSKMKCHENVRFMGIRSDVDSIMSSGDLFLMPSLFEGFPVTGIEALSCGLPCVFSTSVTKEIHVDSYVKFVDLWDRVDEWVDNIHKLILTTNGKNRLELQKVVRKRKYDIDSTISALFKEYVKSECKS